MCTCTHSCMPTQITSHIGKRKRWNNGVYCRIDINVQSVYNAVTVSLRSWGVAYVSQRVTQMTYFGHTVHCSNILFLHTICSSYNAHIATLLNWRLPAKSTLCKFALLGHKSGGLLHTSTGGTLGSAGTYAAWEQPANRIAFVGAQYRL